MMPIDSFNSIFSAGSVLILIIFIAVFILIIFQIVKGIKTWSYNNAQPKLTVFAKVVSKRENVSAHMHNDANNFSHASTSTTYYVTFEVESGDRMEFVVDGSEYGLLVEQDTGNLTFQGSRYLEFKRTDGEFKSNNI